jgi:hypothetical protein
MLEQREHKYSQVASLIMQHKVALCLEFILLDTARASTNIDVIHLGNVERYALVWLSGGAFDASTSIHFEDGDVWSAGKTWFDFARDTVFVCGHAGTVANNMLETAIHEDLLESDRKTERERISELRDFLLERRRDGLVVCDVGVVWQLKSICPAETSLRYVLVDYETPIPAGLAFDGNDEHWRTLLGAAMTEIALSQDAEVLDSLCESAKLLGDLGGRWTLQFGSPEGRDLRPRPNSVSRLGNDQ